MNDGHNYGEPESCRACVTAGDGGEGHSVCWACGHLVDHATGHECGMLDD